MHGRDRFMSISYAIVLMWIAQDPPPPPMISQRWFTSGKNIKLGLVLSGKNAK